MPQDRRPSGAGARSGGGRSGGGRSQDRRPSDRKPGRKPARDAERTPRSENQQKYDGPPIPEHITGRELDRSVQAQLKSLPEKLAQRVARHLVAAGELIDSEPKTAYEHTLAARSRAGRLAVVREAVGESAYAAGEYTEALAELRAAKRMNGVQDYVAIMADCERALGRPDRALTLIRNTPKEGLAPPLLAELTIVEAGARRDRGEIDAALRTLESAPLLSKTREPWVARLRYAYADTLLAASRPQDALTWFHRTDAVDAEANTDAVGAGRRAREDARRGAVTVLGSCDEPLSSAYDVAVLDLDGVVYVGPDAVPGAPEALNAAQDGGMHLAFVTNNAARTPDTVGEQLRSLGVDAHDEDVVTSAQATARLLAKELPQGSKVFLVGGEGLEQALLERGLEPVTEPARRRRGGGTGLRPRHAVEPGRAGRDPRALRAALGGQQHRHDDPDRHRDRTGQRDARRPRRALRRAGAGGGREAQAAVVRGDPGPRRG